LRVRFVQVTMRSVEDRVPTLGAGARREDPLSGARFLAYKLEEWEWFSRK
jgi:hypothetical protein